MTEYSLHCRYYFYLFFLLQNCLCGLAKPIPTPRNYYASKIVAISSQYSKHGAWSAAAALGAPDGVSWCASDSKGHIEFMEVEFPKHIAISSISIQFNHGTGTLTHVSIFDQATNSYDYVFVRPLPIVQNDGALIVLPVHPSKYSNQVKIHVKNDVYAYIDSIQISGILEKPEEHKAVLSTSLDVFNGLRREFTTSDPDITDDSPGPQPTYKSLIVEQGTWILYNTLNFSDNQKKISYRFQKIDKGTAELHFQPKSIRSVPVIQNSVTLFEHVNYGGLMITTHTNQPNLKDFSVLNEEGVSSIIVQPSAEWEFYTGVNYTGQMFTLSYGSSYNSPSKFFNQSERIQSIKRAESK